MVCLINSLTRTCITQVYTLAQFNLNTPMRYVNIDTLGWRQAACYIDSLVNIYIYEGTYPKCGAKAMCAGKDGQSSGRPAEIELLKVELNSFDWKDMPANDTYAVWLYSFRCMTNPFRAVQIPSIYFSQHLLKYAS